MIKINYMKIILKEGLVGPVSRSIRRLASPKRKLKKKVLFLVEGKTEKNIIFHLFPLSLAMMLNYFLAFQRTHHLLLQSFAAYNQYRHWVAKRRDSLDIVFVICDLDRAREDTERESLIKTIKFLENANNRNNIFLSCPDFEQWMFCGLPGNNRPLYRCLGYANKEEQKADEHLFSKYTGAGGSFSTKILFRKTFILYEKEFLPRNYSERIR